MDFQPTEVKFGDLPGYGQWDIGHGREHIRFVQVLQARNPPILLPDADFLSLLGSGSTMRTQLETHQVIHNLLRNYTNVQGVDYSEMRLDEETDFYSFLSYHSDEHQQIRQALGII